MQAYIFISLMQKVKEQVQILLSTTSRLATQTCSLTSSFIYIFIHFHSNQGTGQQCCYNEIGDLIVGPRNGGSLDRVHVEAGVPALSHFFHDIVPYWDCCMLSDNCKKYFEKRPSNDGAKYIPPRPGMKPAELHGRYNYRGTVLIVLCIDVTGNQ